MAGTAEKPRIIQQLGASEAALARRLGIEEAPYIPPCEDGMYGIDNYGWDGCFITETLAHYGYYRKSARQMFAITDGQYPDGFIANVQFPRGPIRLYPEHYTFMEPTKGSNYTFQPILATAVHDIYTSAKEQEPANETQAINADVFLEKIYPKLKNFYGYFARTRQNSPDDPLLGNIHPHETGRDSDPTFDFIKPLRIRRRGTKDFLAKNKWNRTVDYLGAMALNLKARAVDWNPEAIREDFWVNDVMFNCLYVENLYKVSALADQLDKESEAEEFRKLAEAVQQQILTKMWSPDARDGEGAFYALDRDSKHIEVISISNLMPLLLPNISSRQLESLLDLMDGSFDTNYPLPTVATDDTGNYDPHYEEKDRHWRGPTWPVANHLLMEGLIKQIKRDDIPSWLIDRCQAWLERLESSNQALIERGYFEHYDPQTGEGQRGHRTQGHIFGAIADVALGR